MKDRRTKHDTKSPSLDVTTGPPTPEQIRARAHAIYEARGSKPGHELEDWLQAERELQQDPAWRPIGQTVDLPLSDQPPDASIARARTTRQLKRNETTMKASAEKAMPKPSFVRRAILLSAFAAILAASTCSYALTISSGPSFTQATNAPLAGVLALTTDAPSRVSVSVNDGTGTWDRSFYDYGTTHSVPLLGFKPGRTNTITVTVYDRYRNAVTTAQPLAFVTDPLPSDFPKIVLLTNQPEKMEPGYTLFRVMNMNANKAYLAAVDSAGAVGWYSGVPTIADVRQLANGDLFIPLTTNFVEMDMLGNTLRSWVVPSNLAINSHDGVPTDHDTILYLNDASRVVTNFPSSATDPKAPLQTTSVDYNQVVEISATNAALLHTWSLIDMLDPTRIDYNSFEFLTPLGWDCEHANAVIEDPSDDSLIVSMRHQDAVIKFSRATGQLKWILGPHENWGPAWQPYLLTPVGTPFQWNYGQHAPRITPQGTLLLYDDGNYRASPFDAIVPDASNYSRAVEYSINDTNMTVSQVWEYGRNVAEPLFTFAVGIADWLPQTGNVLVDFGYVTYVNGAHPSPFSTNAIMVRIKEVTHDPVPQVVFDLALFDYANTNSGYLGNWVYRARRIPDLYAHPANPVADLTVTYASGTPLLQFWADDRRTYVIEASTDLVNWQAIGAASEEEDIGSFDFADTQANAFPARYYRVITQ